MIVEVKPDDFNIIENLEYYDFVYNYFYKLNGHSFKPYRDGNYRFNLENCFIKCSNCGFVMFFNTWIREVEWQHCDDRGFRCSDYFIKGNVINIPNCDKYLMDKALK